MYGRIQMNIQIIGIKKNSHTRAAERYFKERRIQYHFVDLTQRKLSHGELENIARSVPPEELIDTDSKEYHKRGLPYMEFDIMEELIINPLLLKMPVVRNGGKASAGYTPEVWKEWLRDRK
jgi:arsenate reductase-like glutaredoxin family protein